jgi:hypothetical protein
MTIACPLKVNRERHLRRIFRALSYRWHPSAAVSGHRTRKSDSSPSSTRRSRADQTPCPLFKSAMQRGRSRFSYLPPLFQIISLSSHLLANSRRHSPGPHLLGFRAAKGSKFGFLFTEAPVISGYPGLGSALSLTRS